MEQNYREMLRQQLDLRRLRNPAYSLRAFARDLGISSSRLCEVVTGQQRLSLDLAQKISERLNLPDSERRNFLDLVQIEINPNSQPSKLANLRLKKRLRDTNAHNLSEYQVEVLTSWRHLAILETITQGPQTIDALAERFGIKLEETELIIRTLQRLKLIKRKKGTQAWQRSLNDIYCGGAIPSSAIRRLHQEALNLAQNALHYQNFEKRTFNTLILSLPEARRTEAKARLHEFVREFNTEFGQTEKNTPVYALTIQLFSMEVDSEVH